MIKRGNVGVIVTRENGLMVVENVHNGLVYCHPLRGTNRVHVCTIGEFWVYIHYNNHNSQFKYMDTYSSY